MRGELGILKKKHTALQKDLTDQKENICGLTTNLSKLENKIMNLEKDKVELKNEIKSRDEIIQTKEKDISELKAGAYTFHFIPPPPPPPGGGYNFGKK